ncbi:protein kinase [Anaeramoeba flamelloides]|uniref:Protein kinase n=1 Tax=Anaeramoeba flamelloides TaxID=1746091 RepID=A0ABQ8ZB05_9EUKA|nr:protein kinase [Anaeramoeba flamelloides]
MSLQTVGPYQIFKYATHTETNKPYAIKIIGKQKILKQNNTKELVKKEIAVQKILKHPNILRLFEVFESQNNLFLVLEYISGGELFDYIVEQEKIHEEEALKFFQQIIYGVEYIHSVSIAHRDLKPENLLLDKNKNIKIADFGMARVTEYKHLLKTPCGSPHYVSPELLKGNGYNGKKSDIWSCGVILYVLLTSELPFNEPNNIDLLKSICMGIYNEPKTLTSLQKDLIKRMLTVDPEKRITIEEIKKHPWFNLNLPKQYTHPKPKTNYENICKKEIKEKEIDKNLIDSLKQFGWTDLNEIYTSLLSTEVNTIKVFYYFLKKKNFLKQNPEKKNSSNENSKMENKKSLLPIKKREKYFKGNTKNIIRSSQKNFNNKENTFNNDQNSKVIETKSIFELENLIEFTEQAKELKIDEYQTIMRKVLNQKKSKKKKKHNRSEKFKLSINGNNKNKNRKKSPLREKLENFLMVDKNSKKKSSNGDENKIKDQIQNTDGCCNTENNLTVDLESKKNEFACDNEKESIDSNPIDLTKNENDNTNQNKDDDKNDNNSEDKKKKGGKKKKAKKSKNKRKNKKKKNTLKHNLNNLSLHHQNQNEQENIGQLDYMNNKNLKKSSLNKEISKKQNNSNEKFQNLKIKVGEKNHTPNKKKSFSVNRGLDVSFQRGPISNGNGTPRFHRTKKKTINFVPLTPKQSEIGTNKKGWFDNIVSKKKQKRLNSKLKKKLKRAKKDLKRQLNNNQNLPFFICNDRIIAISSGDSNGKIIKELQTALNIYNYNWNYKYQDILKANLKGFKIKIKIYKKDYDSIIEYVSQNMIDIKESQNNNTFSKTEKIDKIKLNISETLDELSKLQNRSWKSIIEFKWKTDTPKRFIEETKTLISFINQ